MIKAVGYIRVSTDLQVEEGYGLEIQREEIERHCEQNGIELIGIFSDEASSGAKLFQRQGLMNLLERIEREEIDLLIVPKIDRLSRDAEALGWIKFDMQRRGLKTKIQSLVTSENREGEDAISRMMNSMIAYIAEIERERITQRLSAGREHKRKQGGFAGGRAPLGYYSERGSKILRINPDKVETVRMIFRLKELGLNNVEIANRLNDDGHTTQDGAVFTPVQIKRVLDREALYTGELEAEAIF